MQMILLTIKNIISKPPKSLSIISKAGKASDYKIYWTNQIYFPCQHAAQNFISLLELEAEKPTIYIQLKLTSLTGIIKDKIESAI